MGHDSSLPSIRPLILILPQAELVWLEKEATEAARLAERAQRRGLGRSGL